LKQKDTTKELNVSTQTGSVVRKTLELGREVDRSRGESVDASGKQHLDLTEKSKQWH